MANTSIVEYMNEESVKLNLQKTLGKKTGQFIATVASLYNSIDKLQECDKRNVMLACLTATSLDLPVNPNLGFAYIIPYKNVAQFQIGFKGFIQLAQRSGQFKTINVTDVREGEIESMDRMTGKMSFSWIEEGREKAKTIGYVGYMELINGFSKTLYLTTAELKDHGVKYSQTMKKGYGLWVDEFDSMAKKTIIKLLLSKYAPLTVEMQKAQLADQSIIKGEDDYQYIDNEVETPEDVAKDKEHNRIMLHIQTSKTLAELEKCKKHLVNDEQLKAYADKELEVQNEAA